MVGYNEREKLFRQYRDEAPYGLAVVMKCAAALVFLIVVATIGSQADVQPEMRVAASGQASSAPR